MAPTLRGERPPPEVSQSARRVRPRGPRRSETRAPGDSGHRLRPLRHDVWAGSTPLNEGRGEYPGDGRWWSWWWPCPSQRSTRAGVRTPATVAVDGTLEEAFDPLNEGRGEYPGDGRWFSPPSRESTRDAQRGPG